jgi:hypothetical protein
MKLPAKFLTAALLLIAAVSTASVLEHEQRKFRHDEDERDEKHEGPRRRPECAQQRR